VISAGGRYVAFVSGQADIVPNDTNDDSDVFLRDRDTDVDGVYDELGAVSTVAMSVTPSGATGNRWSEEPMISDDGRYLTFTTASTDIIPNGAADDLVFVDRTTGQRSRLNATVNGTRVGFFSPAAQSGDARRVAFVSPAGNLVPGDINDGTGLYVRTTPAR
jgi:hypothetical protein